MYGAAFERVINFGKALIHHDNNSRVYLCSPLLGLSKANIFENAKKYSENIYIVGDKNEKLKPTLLSVFKNLRKIKKQIIKDKDNSCCLVIPPAFYIDVTIIILFKLVGRIKIIYEKNELKRAIALNKTLPEILWKKLIYKSLIPINFIKSYLQDMFCFFYDGVIVISENIKKNIFNRNIIKIPILVDTENISKVKANNIKDNLPLKIGYFGFISQNKDGVWDLLWAVNECAKVGINYAIHLYGQIPQGGVKSISKILKDTKSENYKINNSIPHNKAIDLMQEYDLLALTRPSNLQTETGFSTKLAEYLSSGSAVLVSDVSDNLLYIKDGINGFVVKAGVRKSIIDKLINIYSNRHLLSQVGIEGRKTAEKFFDYRIYSEVLYNFISKASI
jgi:glycosyltransferase involved in cell wall biosynthesis